jgi:hypothetical protein
MSTKYRVHRFDIDDTTQAGEFLNSLKVRSLPLFQMSPGSRVHT